MIGDGGCIVFIEPSCSLTLCTGYSLLRKIFLTTLDPIYLFINLCPGSSHVRLISVKLFSLYKVVFF